MPSAVADEVAAADVGPHPELRVACRRHSGTKLTESSSSSAGNTPSAMTRLVVVQVVDEEVERLEPLHEPALDLRPLLGLDHAGHDIEGPGPVDPLAVGVDGEGDPHRQDVEIGQVTGVARARPARAARAARRAPGPPGGASRRARAVRPSGPMAWRSSAMVTRRLLVRHDAGGMWELCRENEQHARNRRAPAQSTPPPSCRIPPRTVRENGTAGPVTRAVGLSRRGPSTTHPPLWEPEQRDEEGRR